MHRLAAALVLLVLPSSALAADEATQLWLDHAVSAADHVVRGRYGSGRLEVAKELKGKLTARIVGVERDEVELKDEDLVPGTPHLKGDGVFFLLGRFDGEGADARRFMEWQGTEGVAWEGTVAFLGYRPNADDKERLVEIASRADFETMLAGALARDTLLGEALAVVDTKARVAQLLGVVKTTHHAPAAAESDLGPDPFTQRALIEIGHAGAVEALDEVRRGASTRWLKAAAVRAMAPSPGSVKRLEAIATDKTASEDEVVAAIDMLFSSDHADLETLEKLSLDERVRVRRAVASALREKVKDLRVLERLMKDKDPTVRGAATEAARAAARRLALPMPGDEKPPKDDEDEGGK